MAISDWRLYLDNEPADRLRLDRIEEIRVDQAIDMAAEVQITMPLGRDDDGEWPAVLDATLVPFSRVRVEVSVGSGDFVPLIEGRVVAHRLEMGGGPNESRAVIVAHDESAMMNREDKARLFDDMPPEDIAAEVFGEYGLTAETEASGVLAPSLERKVTQRGTDFSLLRRLARRANMVVYVEPGAEPGETVGRFRKLPLAASGLPELVLTGAERNVNRLTLEFDALSPVTAEAQRIDPADLALLSAEVGEAATRTLGDEATAAVVGPARIFADAGPDQSELEATTQAAVDRGAWAFSGEGEVSAEIYPAVMRPYQIVAVAGAGSRMSGEYLVSEVSHVLRDDGYKQSFALRRNARSGGGGGGLLGAVF